MIKVIKINDSLNVSFDYDADIVSKVKTISGRKYNPSNKSCEEILPKPQTEMQKFTHLCDYLASRKMLEVNFNVEG